MRNSGMARNLTAPGRSRLLVILIPRAWRWAAATDASNAVETRGTILRPQREVPDWPERTFHTSGYWSENDGEERHRRSQEANGRRFPMASPVRRASGSTHEWL